MTRYAALTLIIGQDGSLDMDVDMYDTNSDQIKISDAEMIKHLSSVLLHYHEKVAVEYKELTGEDDPSGEEIQNYIDFLRKSQL